MNVVRFLRVYDVLSSIRIRLENRLTYLSARTGGSGVRDEILALRSILDPLDDRIFYLGRITGIEDSRDVELSRAIYRSGALAQAQEYAPGKKGSLSFSGVRHRYYSDKGMITIEGREAT